MASLLFARRGNGNIHRVPLGSNRGSTAPSGIVVEDGFFLAQQSFEPVVQVIHVLTSPPIVPTDTFPMQTVVKNVPYEARAYSITKGNIRYPKYGVLNATLRSSSYQPHDAGWEQLYSVHFWPAEYDGSDLAVGSLCSYDHPCEISWLAVGSSATCGVIMDENAALGLVRYFPQPTPHVEFRPLHVSPETRARSQYDEIALDDRLGIFYMANRESPRWRMTVVSYA